MTYEQELQLEGRRKFKEGLVQGREEGLVQGREEGLAVGREEGLAAGREEGLAAGRGEGLVQGLSQAALNMKHDGVATETIMKHTGLTREEIEAL